ncbi:hypothetical protein E05_17020 [Plautia stali symbiont]|nr:hypothetical protein E05_17020 [Plautia stali symbiont]
MREWQDIYTQLRQVVRELGMPLNSEPAPYREVHCALLTGLLSHIGQKDAEKQEFTGARNARFAIFPGSGLFKKPPKWTVVAELVETSRLWGRVAARIDPEWIEPLAQHLLKRSYSEPHWEKAQGAVMATEKVTLYGLPIVQARKVNTPHRSAAQPGAVYSSCADGGRLADASRLLPQQPETAQ